MTSQILIESDAPSCSVRNIQVYKTSEDLKARQTKTDRKHRGKKVGHTGAAGDQDLGERRAKKRTTFSRTNVRFYIVFTYTGLYLSSRWYALAGFCVWPFRTCVYGFYALRTGLDTSFLPSNLTGDKQLVEMSTLAHFNKPNLLFRFPVLTERCHPRSVDA